MSLLRIISFILFLTVAPSLMASNVICVFDPVGRNGEIYPRAKDFSSDFLTLGVNFNLVAYNKEKDVVKDFLANKCDGMVVSGFTARAFNRFAASLEAPGLIDSYELFYDVLATVASPQLGKLMKHNGVEVAGMFPMGVVYMYLNDKSLTLPEKFVGKRFQIFDNDPLRHVYAQNWGIKPVYTDTTNIVEHFKSNNVDAMVLPAAATVPFEIDVTLEERDGRVVDIPVTYITLMVLIRSDKFPENFGEDARQLSLDYYDQALELARSSEKALRPHKLKLHPRIKDIWKDSLDDIRQLGLDNNLYDPRMFKLIKKIRCRRDPLEDGCI